MAGPWPYDCFLCFLHKVKKEYKTVVACRLNYVVNSNIICASEGETFISKNTLIIDSCRDHRMKCPTLRGIFGGFFKNVLIRSREISIDKIITCMYKSIRNYSFVPNLNVVSQPLDS